MEAKSRPFTFVRDVKNFVIPFFQRGYEWEEENWHSLLETMADPESSHFLGSFIMKQMHTAIGDPQRVYLIDGQQRITTLSIMLKVLYDLYPDRNNVNVRASCDDIWFYRKQSTDTEKFLKITHSYLDKVPFETIITMEYPSDEFINAINKESHKILRCYKYYYNILKKYSEKDRITLLNLILEPAQAMIIVIDIKENDDEQTIFRTINSEGSPLSIADIIKNDIFNTIKFILLKDNLNNEELEKKLINLYQSTWEKTFLRDEETAKFWRKKRATGRIQRDNLSILLHIYAVIKHFYPSSKASMDQLNKYYKLDRLDNLQTLQEASDFLYEICAYAEEYRKYISISADASLYYQYDNNYENILLRVSHILKILDISTLDPFVIYVMRDIDESQKVQYLSLLEKYIMRRLLAQESTKNYNKEVNTFIHDINNLKDNITNEQILLGIKHLKDKQATLVLFWIELYLRSTSNKYSVKSLPYKYSLEHVLPKKWKEKNWPLISHYTQDQRNEKILYLGNLTLLMQPLNSAISNNSYQIKMDGNGTDYGIMRYAGEFILNQPHFITDYTNGDHSWNESKIEQRTDFLYKILLQVWPSIQDKNMKN